MHFLNIKTIVCVNFNGCQSGKITPSVTSSLCPISSGIVGLLGEQPSPSSEDGVYSDDSPEISAAPTNNPYPTPTLPQTAVQQRGSSVRVTRCRCFGWRKVEGRGGEGFELFIAAFPASRRKACTPEVSLVHCAVIKSAGTGISDAEPQQSDVFETDKAIYLQICLQFYLQASGGWASPYSRVPLHISSRRGVFSRHCLRVFPLQGSRLPQVLFGDLGLICNFLVYYVKRLCDSLRWKALYKYNWIELNKAQFPVHSQIFESHKTNNPHIQIRTKRFSNVPARIGVRRGCGWGTVLR